MYQLLSGGYEGQVSGDYLKPPPHLDPAEEPAEDKVAATLANENNVKYRIKKSKSKFITEQKDNYRAFVLGPNGEELLVDYRDAVDHGPSRRKPEKEDHWTTTNLAQYGWRTRSESPQREELEEEEEEDESEDEEAKLEQEKARLAAEKKKRRARSAKRGILQAKKGMRQSEKNRIDRINQLHSTTRWLPDSAFTTFFGKPAFHAYGKGNTNPTYGGPIYGQYMLSHSINPECGSNMP
jgi:hypothetical protein